MLELCQGIRSLLPLDCEVEAEKDAADARGDEANEPLNEDLYIASDDES